MKKLFLTTMMVAALIMLNTRAVKSQTFNPQLASVLQDTLNFYVAGIPNIKGMSASVYLPGQGTWTGVTGVSSLGNPINAAMKFGIASNSKLFSAVAILILAENNILSLDDSLHTWLPTYNNINSNITIRQLLNHTSGISDPFFASPWFDTINNNSTRIFTANEVLGWVGPPLFAPGTSWGYSNTNYVLAGMIAENASGYSMPQLIRDSILSPLNLNNTFFDVAEPELPTIAHRWWNTIDYHDTSRVGLHTAIGCAGAMFSNSGDMAKWYNGLFGGQLLSPASFAQLTNFIATTNPSQDYGLGLHRQTTSGLTYWGHGGTTWGYRSKMIYDSCMSAVVCGLSNSFPSGQDAVTFKLYQTLFNTVPRCPGEIGGLQVVCQGQSNVIYNVPSIMNATSYVWTLPTGATGTSNTSSITVSYGAGAVSGMITVKGVNLYGESALSSLQVTVNTLPGPVTVNGGGTFCKTATLTTSGGSGGTIYWQGTTSNGTSLATPAASKTVSSSGTYYFRSYNSNCGWGNQGSATVTVNSIPNSTITPAGPTSFCAGGSVVLNANVSLNRTYQWKKSGVTISGATSSAYTANQSGTYKVTVTNTLTGCSGTTATGIVVTKYALPAATVTPQGPTTFCAGQNVALLANSGANLTYQWRKNGVDIGGAMAQTYTAFVAGNYKVNVTNSSTGCSRLSAAVTVVVNCRLEDQDSHNFNAKISPNPFNGVTTFSFEGIEGVPLILTVMSADGRLIERKEIGETQGTVSIGDHWLPGTYFVRVVNGQETRIFRLVKQ